MKTFIAAVVFSVVTLGAAEIATPWNKMFESGKVADSTRWRTRVSIGESEGKKFIQLSSTPRKKGQDSGFNLHQIPVEPNTIYKLVITAEVDGPDTIENDPAIEKILRISNKVKAGKPLPGWSIMFVNEKNRHFSTESRPWNSFYRKGKRDYVHLFYTPAAARALFVRCHNYGNITNSVKFHKFTLEKIESEACNVNPDFAVGAHNCSGYSYGGALWRIVEEDGRGVLKCNDSWVTSDPVAVKPGEKYTLTVTGAKSRSSKRSASSSVMLLTPKSSINGKRIKGVLHFSKYEYETKSLEFTIPEGVIRVRITLNRGDFKLAKLVRSKQ